MPCDRDLRKLHAKLRAVDHFDDRELGDLDSQPDWFATSGTASVDIHPEDDADQTLPFRTYSGIIRRPPAVPDGEWCTLFFRFRF